MSSTTKAEMRGQGSRRGRRPGSGGLRRLIGGMSRGFSLAEILVVLIILIIGIFAAIRLFPEGFVAINASANSVIADTLSKREEDRARKFLENLPLGVVGVDPTTGQIRTALTPSDLLIGRPYTDNPIAGYTGALPDDPRFSHINAARRVLGEAFKIPPPSSYPYDTTLTSVGGAVSLYHVLYSPLYSDVPSGGAALGLAAYSGTPLQRVVFSDPPTDDNWNDLGKLGVFGYGVDYDRGLLYFLSAPYDRVFKIEFTYRVSPDASAQSVPDNSIYIQANTTPNQMLTYNLYTGAPQPPGVVFTPLPNTSARLVPSSDFLYRRFQQLAVGDAFTSDPYQFKVYDTLYGLMGFNPIASSLALPSRQGRGLTARVDYDVDDWTIIRQDETVPVQVVDASATGVNRLHAVKLATAKIKRVGDLEDTINLSGNAGGVNAGLEYAGLMRNYPAGSYTLARPGTPGVDLVIVDIETGLRIDSRTLQRPNTTLLGGVTNANGEIDYAAGVIHLRDDGNSVPQWSSPAGGGSTVYMSPAGRHVRIYYRTYNDFGVAAFKPYSRYLAQPDVNFLGAQQYTPNALGYVLFTPAEVGKTVAVDYTYLRTYADSNGNPVQGTVTETGEMLKVRAPSEAGAPDMVHGWIRLSRFVPDAAPANDPVAGSLQITGVRGVSFHTHVLWKEASRWRNLRRSTVLNASR